MISKKAGIIPLVPSKVTTSGFRWNICEIFFNIVLNKFKLLKLLAAKKMQFEGLISTSNEIIQENLTITSSQPILFVFELKNNNKVQILKDKKEI